jgi:hypothetical protein
MLLLNVSNNVSKVSKWLFMGLSVGLLAFSHVGEAKKLNNKNDKSIKRVKKINLNDPKAWCADGYKIEFDNSSTTKACYDVEDDFSKVILKYATRRDVNENVLSGTRLCTRTGQDISHIIFCPAGKRPDLTAVATLLPSIVVGNGTFAFVVRVQELAGANTSGTIRVRMPFDARWNLDGSFDQSLSSISFFSLQNSQWSHSISNDSQGLPEYHVFTSNSVISSNTSSTFGFQGRWISDGTSGRAVMSVEVVPGSGFEKRTDNNFDSEVMSYFRN